MTGKFSIGEALQATVSTCRTNLITLSLVIIVVMAIPMVLSELFLMPYANDPVKMSEAFTDPALLVQIIGLYLVIMIAYFAATLGAVFGSVEALEGDRPTVGKSLSAGLRGTFPMVIMSVLLVLMICIPLVAIVAALAFALSGPIAADIVPVIAILIGILLVLYISVVWSPAMAVIAFERLGPIATLKRAAKLTRGNRWRLLALTLIWIVFVGSLSFLIGPLSALIAGQEVSILAPKPIGFGDVRAILGSSFMYLVSVVFYVLGATFPAAVYFGLREAIDGMAPNTAAAVFE